MGVLARIEITLTGVENNRLAVGIVGFVERHRARDHRDENGAGMTVPPAVTSRLEGDRLSGDVKRGSGLHFHLPDWPASSIAVRVCGPTTPGGVAHWKLLSLNLE